MKSSLPTDVKQIQQVIQYYEKLIASMPGNVYWLDNNCTTLGCNQNVLDMFNLKSIEQFKGLSFEEMGRICHWGKEVTQSFKKDTLDVIQTGKPKLNIDEPPIADSRGQLRYFLTSRVPIFDLDKKVISVVGISIDITEKKKMEQNLKIALEKAEIANYAKTEFLENMRHDIRTPLTGIVGCAELLQMTDNPKQIREYVNDLVQSSHALLDFLNNILESIQVATGEIPVVKKKFDLHQQLEEIVKLNRSVAAEKQLDLTFHYDESIPLYLIGDPVRVQRIVLELLTNALTFTDKGQVKLSVNLKKKAAKQVIIKITVQDTGIGIPKDKQEEIFLRFKRLTPSYQGIYKGLGLGLTMVKQFIDDLEGEIYVKSELGEGSTFTCLLAFKEPMLLDDVDIEAVPLPSTTPKQTKKISSEKGSPSASQSDSLKKNRILLVEDDRLAAKVVEMVMQELHCTVEWAANAQMAMELLQKHPYQLILMDVGLPDIDGITLTHRIRSQQWKNNDANIPIVGLTAHIGSERKQHCLEAGMNAVILKPLKQEVAKELLATFVQDERVEASPARRSSPVLDFAEVKRILQDDRLIEECRQLMIDGLSEDLLKLADWHQRADWESIQAITHKWQGGASYYGAKRLEHICKKFNDYWATGKRDQLHSLYQQLTQEMLAVKKICLNYNPKDYT